MRNHKVQDERARIHRPAMAKHLLSSDNMQGDAERLLPVLAAPPACSTSSAWQVVPAAAAAAVGAAGAAVEAASAVVA